MKLRDADLLVRYMQDRDFSQARMGRYAGCSRQFIFKLVNKQVSTCSDDIGILIEEALGVLPGTLFMPMSEPARRAKVAHQEKAA